MRIEYLADHERFVVPLAQWHQREWAHLYPDYTLETWIAELRASSGRRAVPTVFVAFEEENLLGSAMLIAHDMDTRMDLSPWVASVFVAPTHRGHGIGAMLMDRVVEEAGVIGNIPRLYLYTPNTESFYQRLGWTTCEHTFYRGASVAVMTKEVPQHHPASLRRDTGPAI